MIDKDLRKGDREKDLLDKLNSFTKNFREDCKYVRSWKRKLKIYVGEVRA